MLSAGFGQRLRPLTRQLPKPLLPVLGKTAIARTLDVLAAAGCERAFVNLHHLGDRVRDELGEAHGEIAISYSPEKEILGTLGALGPVARPLSDCDAALMINSDSLCRWPIAQLVRRHLRREAVATLLAVRGAPFAGNVAVAKDGRLLQLRHDRELPGEGVAATGLVFGGAQVLSRELLDRVAGRTEPGDVVGELYEPLLDEGRRLEVVVTSRDWHDLGTPWRYLQGLLGLARRKRRVRGSWVSSSARLGRGVALRRAVVESDVEIGTGCRLESSAVLPGASLEEGCRLRESIVAPGVVLPAGTGLDRRLVTPLSDGRDPSGRDSVVGQLVYTPIEAS